MRQKLLLGLAWGIVASAALAVVWPMTFAGAGDERPDKGPPPDGKRPPPPPPPPPGPNHLDQAVEDLQLSKAQKSKVDKIVRTHHEKMRKIMEKAHKDLLAQMKAVLSKEQYAEFEKAMRRPGPGGPPGDRPPPREPGKRPPPPPPPPPPDDSE